MSNKIKHLDSKSICITKYIKRASFWNTSVFQTWRGVLSFNPVISLTGWSNLNRPRFAFVDWFWDERSRWNELTTEEERSDFEFTRFPNPCDAGQPGVRDDLQASDSEEGAEWRREAGWESSEDELDE